MWGKDFVDTMEDCPGEVCQLGKGVASGKADEVIHVDVE